jgi:hypothetical protein
VGFLLRVRVLFFDEEDEDQVVATADIDVTLGSYDGEFESFKPFPKSVTLPYCVAGSCNINLIRKEEYNL